MHETMKRLYEAAREMKAVEGQTEVANLLRQSPQTLNNWESRGISKAGAILAQTIIGCDAAWITDGVGYKESPNTSNSLSPYNSVPLISWVQAGEWSEIIDNFMAGDAEEWLPCPVTHGPRTFVLMVRGESMSNPHGQPSFSDGDLIFVDPDRQWENGSLVVVRLDDEKEATFKKLIIEGNRKFLRPLNPAWPDQVIEINGNATICGVAIFKGGKL